MGSTVLIILGVVALVAMVGLFAFVNSLLNPQRTARDRLSDLGGNAKVDSKDPAVEAIAQRIAKLAESHDEDQKDVLKRKLMQAGYRDRGAAQVFNAVRVGLALFLPLIAVPIAALLPLHLLAGAVLILASVGYYLPMAMLDGRVQARQASLLKPFPDALDLLVTCVESGLGLDAAIKRVATEMEGAAPDLASEFMLVTHEISAGVPRMEALKHLADRTGLDELKSLVNMLVQADRFGTSIARSLRIHSGIVRAKRVSRAEEEAAKVSPKLTVAMILFLMPTLMIVLLGPACVRIKIYIMSE